MASVARAVTPVAAQPGTAPISLAVHLPGPEGRRLPQVYQSTTVPVHPLTYRRGHSPVWPRAEGGRSIVAWRRYERHPDGCAPSTNMVV